jgi:hypothetical protein
MKKSLHFTSLFAWLILFMVMIIPWAANAQINIPFTPLVCGSGGLALPANPAQYTSPTAPICTDPTLTKYVRVAVHFILADQVTIQRTIGDSCGSVPIQVNYFGPGNFTETNDGHGNNSYNGYKFAEEVISNANNELQNNPEQWRKTTGQNYPTPPPTVPVRWLLNGVYFHRDDAVYQNYSGAHSKYDVGANTVIDIYCGWWPTAGFGGAVTSLGADNKFCYINLYDRYLMPNCRNWALKEAIPTTISHEIFHSFNINHSWNVNDQCDDTPLGFQYQRPDLGCASDFANCWSYSPNNAGCADKPCDEWSKISNNIMDYNQYYPHATTVCQIARINTNLSNNGNPYIHSCNGCMPAIAFCTLPKEVMLCQPYQVLLNGQACFNENQYLIEICEVLDNDPNTCIGGFFNSGWKNGQLSILNLAGLYSFRKNKTYKIKVLVGNSGCPGSDEWSQTIKTLDCTGLINPCCFELAAVNPVTDNLIRVSYRVPAPGDVAFNLVNLTTMQVYPLQQAVDEEEGDYQKIFNGVNTPSGSYALQAVYRGQPYAITLIKQ